MRSGAVLLLCIAGTTAFPATAQPAPADRTAPGAGASRYAGTWQGRILTQARDSQLVTWTWVEGPAGTGSLTFGEEMTSFPTREHPVPVDSIRFELLRPLDGPDSTVLRFVGLARGDSISGIVSVRIKDGRTGRRRFEGRTVARATGRSPPGRRPVRRLTVPSYMLISAPRATRSRHSVPNSMTASRPIST